MSKQIIYGEEARKALQAGIDKLSDYVNHPWPERPQRRPG